MTRYNALENKCQNGSQVLLILVVTQCFRRGQYELMTSKVKKNSWYKKTRPLSKAYQTHCNIISRLMICPPPHVCNLLSKCYVCPASCCLHGSRLRVKPHKREALLAVLVSFFFMFVSAYLQTEHCR